MPNSYGVGHLPCSSDWADHAHLLGHWLFSRLMLAKNSSTLLARQNENDNINDNWWQHGKSWLHFLAGQWKRYIYIYICRYIGQIKMATFLCLFRAQKKIKKVTVLVAVPGAVVWPTFSYHVKDHVHQTEWTMLVCRGTDCSAAWCWPKTSQRFGRDNMKMTTWRTTESNMESQDFTSWQDNESIYMYIYASI